MVVVVVVVVIVVVIVAAGGGAAAAVVMYKLVEQSPFWEADKLLSLLLNSPSFVEATVRYCVQNRRPLATYPSLHEFRSHL
jgi:hypothetical protein